MVYIEGVSYFSNSKNAQSNSRGTREHSRGYKANQMCFGRKFTLRGARSWHIGLEIMLFFTVILASGSTEIAINTGKCAFFKKLPSFAKTGI